MSSNFNPQVQEGSYDDASINEDKEHLGDLAEQEYDYGQSDAIEDSMARVSLLLIEAQEITLGASWPSFYAGDSGAGDAGWQGWVMNSYLR